MRKLRVGLDCDDVILECTSYALELANQERRLEGLADLNINDVTSWGRTGRETDIIFDYFSQPEFYKNQPVIEGARELIRQIQDMGHEVVLITSVYNKFSQIRLKKILTEFPEIPEANVFVAQRKDLFSVDVMLDDGPHNIVGERAISAKYPVLFRRPWNRNVVGVRTVSNYDEFLDLLRAISDSACGNKTASAHKVVCLVGPSGTGKTDIVAELTKNPYFANVNAVTTNPSARKCYEIVSENEFDNIDFVEKSIYGGYQYGIRSSTIEQNWAKGYHAVVRIDLAGAFSLKRIYGNNNVIIVFIKRGSSDIIRDIMLRDISNEEKIQKISALNVELEGEEFADFVIYNNFPIESAETIKKLL